METTRSSPDDKYEAEEDLSRAIAAGDPQAESAFVRRFLPRIRALLLARSRNSDLTADLQQDVLIEALCALRRGQLRDTAKLSHFVIGIARNVLNNHFRGQSRIPQHEVFAEELYMPIKQVMEDEEDRRQIAAQAIASLDTVDRDILRMTLVEDLKPAKIAQRLHMNPDVVRQRKVRATRRVVEFVKNLSKKGLSQKHDADHDSAGHKR